SLHDALPISISNILHIFIINILIKYLLTHLIISMILFILLFNSLISDLSTSFSCANSWIAFVFHHITSLPSKPSSVRHSTGNLSSLGLSLNTILLRIKLENVSLLCLSLYVYSCISLNKSNIGVFHSLISYLNFS